MCGQLDHNTPHILRLPGSSFWALMAGPPRLPGGVTVHLWFYLVPQVNPSSLEMTHIGLPQAGADLASGLCPCPTWNEMKAARVPRDFVRKS